MNYEVLYFNDNGTAKVRMTIGDKILEQDFDCADLDTNVKQGMAVFKSELDRNIPTSDDDSIVGVTTEVKVLPEIPAEDFEPEPPADQPIGE